MNRGADLDGVLFSALLENSEGINTVDEEGYTPIMRAAAEGDLLRVKRLLVKGADPNATHTGEGALHKAIWANHLEIAKLLIAAQADVNQPDIDGYRPLAVAKSNQAIDILFAAGADPELAGEINDNQIDLLALCEGSELAAYAHAIFERKKPGYRGAPLHAAACPPPLLANARTHRRRR